MPEIRCPCCGEMIEVTYLDGGKVTCLGKGKETDPQPKEGPFFDKTLHPPTLTLQAHEKERERFKKALGELPKGSVGTEEAEEDE